MSEVQIFISAFCFLIPSISSEVCHEIKVLVKGIIMNNINATFVRNINFLNFITCEINICTMISCNWIFKICTAIEHLLIYIQSCLLLCQSDLDKVFTIKSFLLMWRKYQYLNPNHGCIIITICSGGNSTTMFRLLS